MKTQTVGILLCALHLSSFGHEILNRHLTFHQTRKSANALSSSENRKGAQTRHDVNSVDSGSDAKALRIIRSDTNNAGAYLNTTAEVAYIVDSDSGYVALFYGSSGAVIVINLQNETGVYTSSSKFSWNARSVSFDDFFRKLPFLNVVYEDTRSCGEEFKADSISPKISQQIQLILLATSQGEYSVSQREAFTFLVHYSDILVRTLRGPLKGFVQMQAKVSSTIHSFKTRCVLYANLGEVVSKIKGGVSVLANLQINWEFFENAPSSITLFLHIFSKLNDHNIDVKPILRDHKDNISGFVAGFGGASGSGINGVMRIRGKIRGIVLNKSSVYELVDTLLEYFLYKRDNNSSLDEFKKELQALLDFIRKIGATNDLKHVVTIYQGLIEGRNTDKDIDFYSIVTTCFKSNADPVRSIVNILVDLQGLIKIEISVGVLLYNLINLLTESSADTVRTLTPEVTFNSAANILVYLFRGAKIQDLSEDLLKFLQSRPILGNIIKKIACVLNEDKIPIKELFERRDLCEIRCSITKKLKEIIKRVNSCQKEDGGSPEVSENDKKLNGHSKTLHQHNGSGAAFKKFLGRQHQRKQKEKSKQLHEKHSAHFNFLRYS